MELSTSSRTAQSEVWPLLVRVALVLNGIIQLVYFLNAPVMRAVYEQLDTITVDVYESITPGVDNFAILLIALMVALSVALAVAVLWRGQAWLSQRLAAVQSLPVWVTAFLGLSVYWGLTLRAASLYLLALNVWWVLAYLVWNVLVGAGWLLLLSPPAHQPEADYPLSRRVRLALAGFFGAVVVVVGTFHLWAFAIYVAPDSLGYISTFQTIFTRSQPVPLRSPTYLLMNAAIGGSFNPYRIAWMHIILAALTTGFWVYFLSRRSILLAVILGTFLSLDISWSMTHRTVLTESPYATAHLLAIGLLVSQFDRRERVPPLVLVLTGMLFAVAGAIRSSGVVILIPFVAMYLLFPRPIRRVAYVTAGVVPMLVAMMFVTWYRTGQFQIAGQSGQAVAFSMFGNNLFDIENGPASAKVGASLYDCDPEFDQTEFVTATANTIFFGFVEPCLYWAFQDPSDPASTGVSEILMASYVESVTAQPIRFTEILLHEGNLMLAHDSQTQTEGTSAPFRLVDCELLVVPLRVCDMSPDIGRLAYGTSPMDAVGVAVGTLASLPATFARGAMVFSTELLAVGAYLMAFALVMVVARGRERLMFFTALLMIAYITGTVVAGHVFLPRYARMLTPFRAIVSAVVIAVGLRMFFPAIEARWAAFFARREPAIAGVLAVLLAALLGGAAYFFVGSLDVAAYRSPYREAAFYLRDVDRQRHLNLTAEETINPFNPQDTIPYWSDDGLLYASNTQRETAENLDVWFSSYLPGDLRAAGFERVVVDETWWQTDTSLRQARLGDEQLYEVVHHWQHDREPDVWVLAAVDDVMASRRLYNDDTVAIYRVFESGIQVYALDENFNGTLVVAIPEDRIGEAATYAGDNGWTAEYAPGNAPRTYEIVIVDAEGETVLTYPAG